MHGAGVVFSLFVIVVFVCGIWHILSGVFPPHTLFYWVPCHCWVYCHRLSYVRARFSSH